MTQTVPVRFEATARRYADGPALAVKRDGAWQTITWRDYHEAVLRAARGLLALGLEPGKGVVILGYNRPEWFVADMAAIFAGAVPTGLYTTATADQCAYVTEHCEAPIAVVENADYLQTMLAIRERLPSLATIVLMEGESGEPGVLSWQDLLRRGEETPEAELRRRLDAQRADDLATLIYTSGTTGNPKGVMLSHRNLLWTAEAVADILSFQAGDNVVSYLPLSHIAEQMITLHGPQRAGATVYFAESIEKLPETLREVRPEVFFGVPRVWEKIQAAIAVAGAQASPLKRRIARWARAKGLAAGYADQRGEPPPALTGLARKLVHDKVRVKLGLDRTRVCACSAAPISLDTLEFFLSLGIPILEVYGMSECTGPATISRPDRYRTGRAGYALPGAELAIADDGEILIRGPHVFLGYYKDPEATRETLDAEGWIHSGDIGEIDEEGFLKVTDRKKELLITSGGKNVAPAPIEAQLKTIPAVGQAVVVGDGRKYLAALLTVDPERVAGEARAARSPATTAEEAAACPRFRAYVERQVDRVNATLARYETLKRVHLVGTDFTVDGGELTPTMKLKRRVIYRKYAAEIERLYDSA
ncbi:MAG: AMP-binding protein [Thermoanaerobaculia bacterium]|nr:AMP-binding protein [Thermoanaerobaculia bacterium]